MLRSVAEPFSFAITWRPGQAKGPQASNDTVRKHREVGSKDGSFVNESAAAGLRDVFITELYCWPEDDQAEFLKEKLLHILNGSTVRLDVLG